MDSWVDPRFHIAGMSDRAGNKQWFQVWGSRLRGVEVHDLNGQNPVTPEGVAQLQKALPQCKIRSDS
jgi:hypothetical protein